MRNQEHAAAKEPRPAKPASPFLAQYFAAKTQHPDALLFFRMGDFYELFFADAEKAAAALAITLTKRGQHEGVDIPMCGVPVHTAEAYLARLIRAGFRVALCEQMEDPAEAKKRPGKSIVRREVIRLVTPGTLTEEALLEAQTPNRLAAMAIAGDRAALAWADVSTGAFQVGAAPAARLAEEIAAVQPAELLFVDRDPPSPEIVAALAGAALTPRPAAKADARTAARRMREIYEVADLAAFGDFEPAEFAAIGLLLDYVELTQAGGAPRLDAPRQSSGASHMAIDPATRASLEIDRALRGGRVGSLLAAIDRTRTAAGARLLAERLARPLLDRASIVARHDSCAFLLEAPERRGALRSELDGVGDLSRALQRLALDRGGPRDLAGLRDGLSAGDRAAARAAGGGAEAPAEIRAAADALSLSAQPELAALVADLGRALAPEAPVKAADGGFIAKGYDAALDEVRALRDDSRRVIAALQARYAEESGVAGLKIRHNSVLGYHIDATPKQAETLVQREDFRHRQSLAGSVRFTTVELAELDAKIARAAAEALARELALFRGFAARTAALAGPIRAAAEALAVLDVAAASAEWAAETDSCRPEIDDSVALIAEGARHPVVEQALAAEGTGFTPNDCRLDGEGAAAPRLTFITGPNMAGKSTFLRQTALLAILAQAGFYAPARRLRLGLADRVFSRVGAADDLARGRSTFMTEMIETAAILRQAGPRALVILDEIGRGTATFDGLAIAWATAEHLHDQNRCRALFATHYHELTALAGRLQAAANCCLKAKEWKGDIVFLHEVAPGAADRSYGIQAAKLAGLPKPALERARAVLLRLEQGKAGRINGALQDLPLFAADQEPRHSGPSELESALNDVDPDVLTPREALELLYRLKRLAERGAEKGGENA